MKKDIAKPWIILGYKNFAVNGANSLRIESLSKEIGKNKSSFYYLFSDMDIFIDFLLKHHIEKTKLIAEKESKCNTKDELIEILIEHKTDLLFNRELRIHRKIKDFENCFIKTNQITGQAILSIWSEVIGLQNDSFLSELVLKLSIDNFFLQIADESINEDWLHNYFDELNKLVKAFKNKGT